MTFSMNELSGPLSSDHMRIRPLLPWHVQSEVEATRGQSFNLPKRKLDETLAKDRSLAPGGPALSGKDIESIGLRELLTCSVEWMASVHKLFGRNTQTLKNLVVEARTMREQNREEFERLRQLLLSHNLKAEQLRVPEIRNPLLELFVFILRDVDHTKSHKPTKEDLVGLCVTWKCPNRNFLCPLEAINSGQSKFQPCACSRCSEAGFCKECMCILCGHQLGPRSEQSSIRCEQLGLARDGPGCGHSVHAKCALARSLAGVVKQTGRPDVALDGEYLCGQCDKKKDLLAFWRDRLLLAAECTVPAVLRTQLSLAQGVLNGTQRHEYKPLQEAAEKALHDLEGGADAGEVVRKVKQIVEDLENLASSASSKNLKTPTRLPLGIDVCLQAAESSQAGRPAFTCDLNMAPPGSESTPPSTAEGNAAGEKETAPAPVKVEALAHEGDSAVLAAVATKHGATSDSPFLPKMLAGAGELIKNLQVAGRALFEERFSRAGAAAALDMSLFSISPQLAMAALATFPAALTEGTLHTILEEVKRDEKLSVAVAAAVRTEVANFPELCQLAQTQQAALEAARSEFGQLKTAAEAEAKAAMKRREEACALEVAAARAVDEARAAEARAALASQVAESTGKRLEDAWKMEQHRYEMAVHDAQERSQERVVSRLRAAVVEQISIATSLLGTGAAQPPSQPIATAPAFASSPTPAGVVESVNGHIGGQMASYSLQQAQQMLLHLTSQVTQQQQQGGAAMGVEYSNLQRGLLEANLEICKVVALALKGQHPQGLLEQAQFLLGQGAPLGAGNLFPQMINKPPPPGTPPQPSQQVCSEQQQRAAETVLKQSTGSGVPRWALPMAPTPEANTGDGRQLICPAERVLPRKREAPMTLVNKGIADEEEAVITLELLQSSPKRMKGVQPPNGGIRPDLSSSPVTGDPVDEDVTEGGDEDAEAVERLAREVPLEEPISGDELAAADAAVMAAYFPNLLAPQGGASRKYKVIIIAAVARQIDKKWRISLTRRKGKGFRLQLPTCGLDAARMSSSGTSPIGGARGKWPDTMIVAKKLAWDSLGLGEGASLSAPGGYLEPLRVAEEQRDGSIHVALIHPLIARWIPSKSLTYNFGGHFVSWCRADALYPVVRDVPQKFSAAFPRVLRCLELLMAQPLDGWPISNLLNLDKVAPDVLG